MDMHEQWEWRDPMTMHRTFPWFHGGGFDLVLDDLRQLPDDHLVLVECFRLLPQLIRAHLSDPRHAVWLLPTREFRQAAFPRRGCGGCVLASHQRSRPGPGQSAGARPNIRR